MNKHIFKRKDPYSIMLVCDEPPHPQGLPPDSLLVFPIWLPFKSSLALEELVFQDVKPPLLLVIIRDCYSGGSD